MPAMTRRIDYFAMAAMQGMLGVERLEKALIAGERNTGKSRDEILAEWAYTIAEAMEAEAGNH